MNNTTWYNLENPETLDTPALVVYPERVQHNINLLIGMIDDISRLRPHVKTHKNIAVTQLLQNAGITKFKCATIAEAEMLALSNAPDVLLAYQPVGAKIQRFLSLIEQYPNTQFSCLVDSLAVGQAIASATTHQPIRVYIDLNVGMNRTGIMPEKAEILFQNLQKLSGIQVKGFHVYDGNIRDLALDSRKKACDQAFAPVEQLVYRLAQQGFSNLVIVAGGTPTFPIHAQRKDVECSPGTFVFWDKGYEMAFPEQPFLPAALVLTKVISLPEATKICLDLGHKSVAAENELSKRVHFLNTPNLPFVGQSEEHLVLDVPQGHSYQIGDIFYGLPIHICPTVALYEKAFTAQQQQITPTEWKIVARDRKINT